MSTMSKLDYTRLRQRIVGLRLTQQSIAQAVGLSAGHFCQKLQGKYPFKEGEIRKLCWLLNIPREEIGEYFFCYRVEETQQSKTKEREIPPHTDRLRIPNQQINKGE